MPRDLSYAGVMTGAGSILVVCTGNICRSPYIEYVLAHELADLSIGVSSAGTMALVGEPMQDGSSMLLKQLGIDSSGFAARQVVPELVEEVDLVITATRDHRAQVVRAAPRGLRYTFALADFSDLIAHADMAQSVHGESADDTAVRRLVLRAAARRSDIAPRTADASVILDPFRQGSSAFSAMAHQVSLVLPSIEQALRQVVGAGHVDGLPRG